MGCQIKDNAITVDDYQRTSQPQVWAAGECTGFGGSELAIVEGSIAGYAAIGQNEKARQLFAQNNGIVYLHISLRKALSYVLS